MVYNTYRPCDHARPQQGHTMTKSETREISKTIQYGATLGADYLARALSALYRSARSSKSQREILAVALAYSVVSHAEFII